MNRRILLLISLALLVSIFGISYYLVNIYPGMGDDSNSPGGVNAFPVNETEVGDREIISYENETIQEMGTLMETLRTAYDNNKPSSSAIRGEGSQREAELLRLLGKYEPITVEPVPHYNEAFYVRYKGDVYEIYGTVGDINVR